MLRTIYITISLLLSLGVNALEESLFNERLSSVEKYLEEEDVKSAKNLLIELTKTDFKGVEIFQSYLGQIYLDNDKDYKSALKWINKAADKGYGYALYDLGRMYQEGLGVDKNYTLAFDNYLKAAKLDIADAQAQVANLYSSGKGTGQDYKKAFDWLKKAARNEVQKSMVGLGMFYATGQGTEKDLIEARYWLNRSLKLDDERMKEDVYAFLDSMDQVAGIADTEGLIDKSLEFARNGDFANAKNTLFNLADKGNPEAQYYLSKFYGDPDGLNDKQEERLWLLESARNENPDAQFDLAYSLAKGWDTIDIDQLSLVIYWFEKAGYNGRTDAYSMLSVLYDKENRDSLIEMEQAANEGNGLAAYNLGWINARGYLSNNGLLQDINSAENWFRKSAGLGFLEAKLQLKRNYD